MHLICPQCHNTLPGPADASTDEFVCPACGSSFRLERGGSTADFPLIQGQRLLGRFALLEVVGQGTFGTVYRALDPELDRTVAVKVPRVDRLAGPHDLDRFLREARSAAQLRHPAIVPVHEAGQIDGVPYLVTDF